MSYFAHFSVVSVPLVLLFYRSVLFYCCGG